MDYKINHVTSWSITFFWVFLSLGLSILTIYSFLQADWIIKRNLVITNYYQYSKNDSQSKEFSEQSYSNTKDNNIELNLFSNHHNVNPTVKTKTSLQPRQKNLDYDVLRILENDDDYLSLDDNNNINSNGDNEAGKNDIETELLASDEYFLYNEENYTILSSSSSSSLTLHDLELQQNQQQQLHRKLVKVTKVLTTIRFGTLGICSSGPRVSKSESVSNFKCQLYGEDHLHAVSSLWPMVTIIGGSGCVTLCVSAVLSTLAVALPSSKLRYQVATTIGHAQTVAVLLLFTSLLIFPLGFDSDLVHYHCGSSASIYNIGECEVGWAYALVLVCSSLALYCPILVKFTADVRYQVLPKYI